MGSFRPHIRFGLTSGLCFVGLIALVCAMVLPRFNQSLAVRNIEGLGGRVARDFAGVFPPVNVYEDKDNYLLTAELPGVKPEEVEITVTEDALTLKGERKRDDGGNGASYHRRERGSGYFRRIVSLPNKVDPEKVEASSHHGILHVTLPKAEHVKPRQIKVKGAD